MSWTKQAARCVVDKQQSKVVVYCMEQASAIDAWKAPSNSRGRSRPTSLPNERRATIDRQDTK